MDLIRQILNYFTIPPGNVVYHLVLAFSVVAALVWAINLWQASQFPQVKRAILGLAILLGLQIVQFFVSLFASLGLLQASIVLPPLDRAVTLLSLTWIAWLWIFPEPLRIADAATLFLNLLTFAFLGLTLTAWPQTNPSAFLNHSTLNLIWQILSLVFILVSSVALAVRQPNGWIFGMTMLVLAFSGHLATILLDDNGNFPGAVRLAQIALYPFLLALARRFPVREGSPKPAAGKNRTPFWAKKTDKKKAAENTGKVEKPAESVRVENVVKEDRGKTGEKLEKVERVEKIVKTEVEERPDTDKRHYSTDPKTFHALLSLAAETQSERIGNALTRGVAQATLADLCFLITLQGEKNLVITCGYDLIREENINGTTLPGDSVPMLASAIQRAQALRLPASSTSTDLKGLGQALGLGNAGHLLSVPVTSAERGLRGAIMLLSPYSNRLWSAEDQGFLSNVAALFIPILERGQRIAVLEQERNAANNKAATVQKKFEELYAQYDSIKKNASQIQHQAEATTALASKLEESQQLIRQLNAENEQLRNSGGSDGSSKGQLEHELQLALEENAHLKNSIAEANIKMLEMGQRPAAQINSEQADVIASISQELRQPMSSMVGYTDLLLGESVGILGALQRKFIERIKASVERIGGLVEDLIQITTLEATHVEIKPEAVDLNLIIDNAVAYTSTQIREKNITLQLDTPETPLQVQTDREALQQIIIHLLQNAGAATPAEGTIGLQIQLQNQDGKEYLQIQVTDSGGGIAQEDIERVFQRRYRADHTLIQGVGDTSVGLSIAKSLVDAQSGRIWVDSIPGTGAKFNVLLPVNRTAPQDAT